ncbi:hypothetical protein GGX14DRAFT_611358 [Mycena pura]|uniref:Zinc finger PHD-type domain-containing protein n=1 Tax=Mycena pura TaxID=153505 RepID=A0AAD6ULK0_9AGAR|nr:hypothetical protein GGX14DRAFT_611358 [Mycena pura]
MEALQLLQDCYRTATGTDICWMLSAFNKVITNAGKQNRKKKTKPTLVISSAHSSRLALATEQEPGIDSDLESNIEESVQHDSNRSSRDNSPFVDPPEDDEESSRVIDAAASTLDGRVGEIVVRPVTESAQASEADSIETGAVRDIEAIVVTTSRVNAPAADVAEEDSRMRRPIRKRKPREDLKDFEEALKECICGQSADPGSDLVKVKNHARCKLESCATTWYHLACLRESSVPKNWVCDACASEGSGRQTPQGLIT